MTEAETGTEEQADTPSMRRRLAWYRLGANALASIDPSYGGYGCPQCLQRFGEQHVRERILTDEDVPPKWAGGRPMVLTCKACNNDAGTRIDSIAEQRHRTLTFGTRYASGPLDVIHEVEDVRQRGQVKWDHTGIRLAGIAKRNPPQITGQIMQVYERYSSETKPERRDFRLEIQMRADTPAGRASWLRSAYLTAFALLGYRYIVQPALEKVRQSIADPHAEDTPLTFGVQVNTSLDYDGRAFMIIDDPAPLRGALLWVYRWYVVILPPIRAADDFYEHAQALADSGPVANLSGSRILAWPTSPVLALDHAET